MITSLSRAAVALALVALISISCAGEKTPAQSERHGFNVVTLVEGLQNPWSIAWWPDGRMLVTERAGRLRIVGRDFRLDPQIVEGLPEIVVRGQGGLFDVALHPKYKENGWIYISYSGPGEGGHG